MQPTPAYRPQLGLFSAAMAVVGGIIGSGVFLNPRHVAQRMYGIPGGIIGAWVLGGVIALLGAFCFAELGARRPRAGGGYIYLREAFGGLPAFLYGWALLLVMATGACAAVAVTFATYAAATFGWSQAVIKPLAIGAIVLLSAVNYVGVRPGAWTQNVFTILKLAALALLIVVALSSGGEAPVITPSDDGWTAPASPVPLVLALGAALSPILFAYGGWQQTNFIAEEIVDAKRTLPRALLLGTSIVVAVYVLANVGYLKVLGAGGLPRSAAPAADVMETVVGGWGRTIISLGIACSTFGFLNLVILVSPRVYQAMAADGAFLPALAKLHPSYHTPAAAIVFQGLWAVVLTLSGTYGQLLDYVVFGDWIFFGLTAATLFTFRQRREAHDGFRVPAFPVAPILFCLAAVYVVWGSIASNPRNALFGAGLILLGIPVFYYWKKQTR